MSSNDLKLKETISNLEKKFSEFRVYGDERDLEIFEAKENPDGPNCEIYIRAPYIYPELKSDPENKKLLRNSSRLMNISH
ncbi:MAG: hypothetical protein HWN66_11395 [Candidatus Helarchaeota archaeon]|nr:hypothetical protein [Candidatus Helarchaeota archaeon]